MNAPPVIVVVDDEISVCRALKRLLLSAGLEVRAFTSGAQLFEYLRQGAADCLVLDLHMPAMSGFDVLQRLATERRRLPVIIITGHDAPESQQRVIDLGAATYLHKPVDDIVLLSAIKAAVPILGP